LFAYYDTKLKKGEKKYMHSLRITSLLIAITLIFSIPLYGMSSDEADDSESIEITRPMSNLAIRPSKKPHSSSQVGNSKSIELSKQKPISKSKRAVKTSQSITSSEEEGYNSEDEYKRHQKAHDRYFRRNSKNKTVRTIVEKFKKEYRSQNSLSVISLDDVSSRSRILLVRELTTLMLEKIEDQKYWIRRKDGLYSRFLLKFKFGQLQFTVTNFHTPAQPGGFILNEIGKHIEIQKDLERQKESSSRIAKSLKNSRKTKQPIRLKEARDNQYRNTLNFLLDLEVARRLQKDEPENDFDKVPVASGIANFLELSSEGQLRIDEFFQRTDTDSFRTFTFPYGPYNIFEGAVLDNQYTKNRRKQAIKNIVRAQKEKSGNLKNSKCEEIHQHYREIFPGSETEESDSYSDIDE
jgi:hypothetical protein